MRFLSKGKRGIVYLMRLRGKMVVVKQRRPESTALNALENEASWLQELNKHHIGPRFYRFDDRGLVMEYIKGVPFVNWYHTHSRRERNKMVREIFIQCRILDLLKVNKYELHHPVKHILVRKEKPVMIDFERCKRTLTPKNVTQFCQFLLTLGYDVDGDGELLKTLLRSYKTSYRRDVFEKIADLFC